MQELILAQAPHAYWLIFAGLVLAGFNLPISEDILVLTGGYLAAQAQSDAYTIKMFLAIFVGAFLGDCVVFGLGRTLGARLLETRLFSRVMTSARRDRIEDYFTRYGPWTLFGGRFIPFGVRNGVIITASIGQVPFTTFALSDLGALSITSTLLFWLGYQFAGNLEQLIIYIQNSYFAIFLGFLAAVSVIFLLRFLRTRLRKHSTNQPD